MDRKDAEIIDALLNRESTVHELSKALFKTRDQHALRRHNSFLRYRLGKLVDDGLVRCRRQPDGRSTFSVPLEHIAYGPATVVVHHNGSPMAFDLGRALVTDTNGKRRVLIFG